MASKPRSKRDRISQLVFGFLLYSNLFTVSNTREDCKHSCLLCLHVSNIKPKCHIQAGFLGIDYNAHISYNINVIIDL